MVGREESAGKVDLVGQFDVGVCHLTPDKEGNLPPSALVPFCFYQGNPLGKKIPEMNNVTVCDKFKATILEGQLCFSLDIAKLEEYPTKLGKSNGLLLLLDPEPYQSIKNDKKSRGSKTGSQNVKVFVNTLAQYTSFGPGSYAMDTLKKMTGTKSFKHLAD